MGFFRRRPRLPRRRLPGRPVPAPAARRALRRLRHAHGLLAQGQSSEAAAIFEDLAAKAARRGIPRAPQLYLQAGRAWVDGGDPARGLASLEQGLLMMARSGNVAKAGAMTGRVLAELRARGLEEEALRLEAALSEAFPGLDLAQRPAPSRGQLPTNCPQCGGSLRPDEVEWMDERTAECAYCGSLVAATG